MIKKSLLAKALVGTIVMLFFILIVFSAAYTKNRNFLNQRILDTLTVIAESYEGQIYQFLEMSKRRVQDFSSDGFIKNQLQKIVRGNPYAAKALNKHLVKNKIVLDKTIHTINVVSLDGRVVASTDGAEIGRDVSGKSYFIKGRDAASVVENHDRHSGEYHELIVSAPILSKDTDRPIGVILNFVNFIEIHNLLQGKYSKEFGAISWGKGKGAWQTLELYLVNKEKLMITESIFIKDAVLKQMVDTLPVQRSLAASEEIAGFYKDYRGVEVVGASMYIPVMEWILLVEVDKDEVLAPVRNIFISVIVMAAVVIVIIMCMFIVFSRKVVNPLRNLSGAADKVAAGNFDIDVPSLGCDEIGVLGRSFLNMSRHLKGRTTALVESNKRLAEAEKIARRGSWEWVIGVNEVYLSEEAYRIFGLPLRGSCVTSEQLLSSVHPDDACFVRKSMDAALANERPFDIEHRMLIDGMTRIVHQRAIVVRDLAGKAIRVLGTVRDITEQIRAEAEKAHLREQLCHAQKMESIGRLAGGIAHDFNNALMAIRGYGELIQMETSESNAIQNYTKHLLATAENATQLTQRLLIFSRKQSSQLKPLNLDETVKSAEHLLLRLIGKNVRLVTALNGNGCAVMVDAGQMEQVLMNLVVNARDAMPEGGIVTVGTEVVEPDTEHIRTHGIDKAGSYAILSVSDTGCGMDEKTKEHIFEPFFTTKEAGKGTGLGLSIVYGIMQQHEGRIDVDSKPGEGTTFRLYLPITQEHAGKIAVEKPTSQTKGTETILLAEDDTVVRGVVRAICEAAGYKVIEAIDGEDAISKLKENNGRVQLFVSDVMMPGKNGKEAYDVIRATRPGMKAIFMSGYADNVLNDRMILDEKLHFVSKPVSASELLGKIRMALDE